MSLGSEQERGLQRGRLGQIKEERQGELNSAAGASQTIQGSSGIQGMGVGGSEGASASFWGNIRLWSPGWRLLI